jgi:hypothetical protein
MEDHPSGSRDFGVGRRRCFRDEIGGRFCANCHVGNIVRDDAVITAVTEGVRAYALDPNTAEKLWEKSEEMVGESFQTQV